MIKTLFSPFRALDQERHKVLEIDSKGNLYLDRSALLCKNEIIKRLTEDNFKLVEPNTIGKLTEFYILKPKQRNYFFFFLFTYNFLRHATR